MVGHCAQCKAEGEVVHCRLADVGLRFLDRPCLAWMVSVGMNVVEVGADDPRVVDRGRDARAHYPSVGHRHISALMQSLRGVA